MGVGILKDRPSAGGCAAALWCLAEWEERREGSLAHSRRSPQGDGRLRPHADHGPAAVPARRAGISWALGKLRARVSGILGDEMGLGKTIQTAVLLQVGGCLCLCRLRAWERRARAHTGACLSLMMGGLGSPGRRRGRAGVAPDAGMPDVPPTPRPPHPAPHSRHPQLARELGLTTGPVAVVVPLSTFGSWEREMAK